MTREQGISQFLTFSVAGEEYAVDIQRVKEIVQGESITHIPSLPEWFRGVLNLRGESVPAVDLGRRFALRETPCAENACAIVIEIGERGAKANVGLLADSVSQVMEVEAGSIQPPPIFGASVEAAELLGVTLSGEKFVLILDVDRIFSEEERTAFRHVELPAALGAGR